MLDRLGYFLAEITDTRKTRIAFVACVGALAGVSEYGVDTGLSHLQVSAQMKSIADSLMIASVVAVITFIEVNAVQARRRTIMNEVESVVALNHHVRNALQAIQYASRMPSAAQITIIDESVDKIDKTLRDLYPIIGHSHLLTERRRAATAGRRRDDAPKDTPKTLSTPPR